MITSMPPAVYKLKHNSSTGYYLDYHKPVFTVTGKNYGNIPKHVNTFWDRYRDGHTSMGVMLTGAPGSGKSRVAELLGNAGLASNMCVVMVTEVRVSIDLIPFIDSLHNMVIIFDEFSKNFPPQLQNKMLTMFSAIGPYKKLFILTENDRQSISKYIRTRPGRIRYSVDYDRIAEDVIIEYCGDKGVEASFIDDIFELYQKAPKFTFDHLQAIVSEKSYSPESTIDELLEILNLDDLVVPDMWEVVYGIDLSTGERLVSTGPSNRYTKKDITGAYFRGWVELSPKPEEVTPPAAEAPTGFGVTPPRPVSLKVGSGDLSRIDNKTTYVFKTGGVEVYFEIVAR